jgi:uncharacterized protein YybS (DUF2232 family)
MIKQLTSIPWLGVLLPGVFLAMLLLIGLFVPFGPILILLSPVLLAYQMVTEGLARTAAVILSAAIILSLVLSVPVALCLVAFSALPGLSMGRTMQKQAGFLTGLGASSIGFVLAVSLSVGIYFFLSGQSPLLAFQEILELSRQSAMELARQFGQTADQVHKLGEQLKVMAETLLRIFPFLVVSMAVASSFLCYWFTAGVLNRVGRRVPAIPPFAHWRFPPAIVLGYAVGFVLVFWRDSTVLAGLYPLGLNLYLFFTLMFSIQGFSYFYYLMTKLGFPKPIRVVLVFWALLIPLLDQASVWLGMLDMALDLRNFRLPWRRDNGQK